MIPELQANEVVMLLLGIGVLIFILGNRRHLKRLPASALLLGGFCALLGAWILTVLEGYFVERPFWYQLFNLIEHVCYAASSVLVAVWCWKVFGRAKEAG